MIKTFFRASDGKEFDDIIKAKAYEDKIKKKRIKYYIYDRTYDMIHFVQDIEIINNINCGIIIIRYCDNNNIFHTWDISDRKLNEFAIFTEKEYKKIENTLVETTKILDAIIADHSVNKYIKEIVAE